jgi:tRNA G18 (ribose-2'-O)-methylase SpoU
MRKLVLIAHNLRSSHNVGSLLRTAEGLGVEEVILSGYTPFPAGASADSRLPHLSRKINSQIHKTALGAETTQAWRHEDDINRLIADLKSRGYLIAALEQSQAAISLPEYRPPGKLAVVLGREVEGVEPEVLAACDLALEIPMYGKKESYNVAQAAAMALYHCRFTP